MKYRHSFHAGNFADVHKHVALLALLSSFKRKEKGFVYLETHAGRGVYDLSHPSQEALTGSVRFVTGEYHAPELRQFAELIANFRAARKQPQAYPGSPAIAARSLRTQDRAVLCEFVPAEARMLERELESAPRIRVICTDGFERLRGLLPPPERRGLVFIDPPYEEHGDFERVTAVVVDALQRFGTGVFAIWYPIKEQSAIRRWHESFARAVPAETLASELWLYPRDSKVALNGSGLLIVNPPFQIAERMKEWLPELRSRLDVGHGGGTSIGKLTHPA